MAEPIGIASGIVTLLGVALKANTLISDLKDAPLELIAINNEISDLRILVAQMQNLAVEDLSADNFLTIPLQATNARLRATSQYLNNLHKHGKFMRPLWVNSKGRARRLQIDLRDARQQLHVALSQSNK